MDRRRVGRTTLAIIEMLIVFIIGRLVSGLIWTEYGETAGTLAFFVIVGGGFAIVLKLAGLHN